VGINEKSTTAIKQCEEKIISQVKNNSDGDNTIKTKDINKNNLWFKLKGLWS